MIGSFLYLLAGGMLLMLGASRLEQIAWTLVRLVSIIAFALLAFVTAWQLREAGISDAPAPFWPGVAAALSAMLLLFVAPLARAVPMFLRVVAGMGGVAGVWAGCSAAMLLSPGPEGPLSGALQITSGVLGALVLGSITVSWLLGHAYLTATTMTIAPLRRLSFALLGSVLARCLFLVITLPPLLDRMGELWLVLLLRVGVGLVAVGIFSYMVVDCVRLRATQSATGILYFASVFAYVGELANQYLIAEIGHPV